MCVYIDAYRNPCIKYIHKCYSHLSDLSEFMLTNQQM